MDMNIFMSCIVFFNTLKNNWSRKKTKVQIFKSVELKNCITDLVPCCGFSNSSLSVVLLLTSQCDRRREKQASPLNLLYYISCTIRFFEDDCLVDSCSRSVDIWLEGFI